MAKRKRAERSSQSARDSKRFVLESQAVGRRLREIRDARGWSREKASQASGVDPNHLFKVEKAYGAPNVSLVTLVRLAEAYGVPLVEFFTYDPVVAPSETPDQALPFVHPKESEKYRTCVPLLDLHAAAGAFGGIRVVEPIGWVRPRTRRRLRGGMFVARIAGHSMEPRIPDGAYALFSSPVTGSRCGRILLVEDRRIADPESGASYTVKRYESEKVEDDLGRWRHTVVRLAPINPEFEPIVLEGVAEEEVAAVAELIEVIDFG